MRVPEVFSPASKNKSLASENKTSAMAITIPSAICSREPTRLLTRSAAERFPLHMSRTRSGKDSAHQWASQPRAQNGALPPRRGV